LGFWGKLREGRLFFYTAYLAAAIAVCSVIFVYNKFHKDEKISIYLQEQVENSQTLFLAAKKAYNLLAELTFEELIMRPEIVSILERADKAEPAERDRLRQELYRMLEPSYLRLKRFNLYQFHFHLPGAISFLRFHQPDKFGDNLWDVRLDVAQANLVREPVSGFEVGRLKEGFRNVFPILKDEKLIATVEISYSAKAIKDYIEAISPTTVIILYPADIIEQHMWKEARRKNFRKSAISENYYVSRRFFASSEDEVIPPDEIYEFNRCLSRDPSVQEGLRSHRSFSSFLTKNGNDYLATFLNIENLEGDHAGYIVFFRKDTFQRAMERGFWQRVLLGWMGSLLFLMLLGYYHRLQLQSKKQLEFLASTDLLTGIYNRRQLLLLLEQAIRLAHRHRRPLSLIFFDIDYFKAVNDQYGHEIGDAILKEVAELVKGAIRQSDIFGRWGGEEFIVVLHDCSQEEAAKKAEALRRLIAGHTFSNGIRLTCSFGVAGLKDDEDSGSLIRRADEALYRAKQHGRNRVEEAGFL